MSKVLAKVGHYVVMLALLSQGVISEAIPATPPRLFSGTLRNKAGMCLSISNRAVPSEALQLLQCDETLGFKQVVQEIQAGTGTVEPYTTLRIGSYYLQGVLTTSDRAGGTNVMMDGLANTQGSPTPGRLVALPLQEMRQQALEIVPVPASSGNVLLKMENSDLCVPSDSKGGLRLSDCNGSTDDLVWEAKQVAGHVCDEVAWNEYKYTGGSVREIMLGLRMDYDGYVNAIRNQGVPKLNARDKRVTKLCDPNFNTYFINLESKGDAAYSKLLTFKALYMQAVDQAVGDAERMFLLSKMGRVLNRNTRTFRSELIYQFSYIVAAAKPELYWLTVLARDLIETALGKFDQITDTPETNIPWKSLVEHIYKLVTQSIWDMHISALDRTMTEYDELLETYIGYTLERTFGSTNVVAATLVIQLTKIIAADPLFRNDFCILKFRHNLSKKYDYFDSTTETYYKIIMPGSGRKEFLNEPYTSLYSITDIINGLGTGAELVTQPTKLVNGQNRCLSVNEGDIYNGAFLVARSCDAHHPLDQIYRSIPLPPRKFGGPYEVVQVDSFCITSPTDPSEPLTIGTCKYTNDQLFESVPLGANPAQSAIFQFKNRQSGQCIAVNVDEDVVMGACDNPQLDMAWSRQPLGGASCDASVWRKFKSETWSVGDLMRRIGLDVDQYLATISKQGVPSLTMADENLLRYCDMEIRQYFHDFDRYNANMFIKLMNYPGTYSARVRFATQQAVYMFIQSKMANRVWTALSPLAGDFVDQFTFFLSIQYPQFKWLLAVGQVVVKKAIKEIDNGSPPELKEWGDQVQGIFNESVQYIWDVHVQVINGTDHTKYEEYARVYQDQDLQSIFGSEEDVQSQITVMLAKEITRVPEMDGDCCVISYNWGVGGGDYYDPVTKAYYYVVLPGKSHQLLFSHPLKKFVSAEDIALSRNGWAMKHYSMTTGWGRCTMPL
ncbi:hypothetical protein H4R33_002246 [Dimargaris cristalligena]|nr:hypothetical protein H4R33_002246 [Dimargaris cristalligena]